MDLKPNEIIFLDFISGKENTITFSEYWKFEYGILAQKTINKFANLGLIKFDLNIKTNISSLTIPQLKDLLRNEGLPLTR